ncbi:MAG: DUF11 domain-containing protein, partial [Bacteroidales bacterium]|nr:DUF11 domain-containing protein [Bacteroidales bacterium]
MFNIHKLSAQRLAKSLTRRRVVSVAEREALRLLQLEDRCNPAPVPTLSAPYDADILLGETANYGFVFSNASGTDTGYAPYLDVAVDTSGADGNDGYAGYPTVVAGGLQMTPVGIPIVLNIGQTTYTNPFTGQTRPVPTGFGAGDTILVYELPFGSFTPGQSTAVSVTAPTSNLADVGHSLPIAFTPGFKSDNPGLSGPPIPGTEVSANATPELYRFRKVYLGPEDETATRPNHPQWYRLEVDIATGQTIDNLTITDLLADSMQITGLTTAQMSAFLASSGLTTDVFNASNATGNPGVPGGTVSYDFGSVTGVDGVDAAFEFQFYVPRDRAVGAGAVLPQTPLTGTDSVLATNTGSTTGTWDPLDTRDGTNVVVSKSEPDNGPHTLQEQSLATQKTVVATDLMGVPLPDGAPIQPGQTLLKYTIDFQVSDYYAFQNLTLQDLIGDGQRLYLGSDGNNPTFLPTLSVTNAYLYNIGGGSRTDLAASAFGGGNILYRQLYTSTAGGDPTGYPASGPNDLLTSGAFTNLPANILPNTNPYAGSTFLQFNISNELIRKLGANAGRLVGGEINNDGSGPDNDPFSGPHLSGTTGKIVYYVLVSQEFSNEHAFVDNSNEATVDQGDILNNSVPLDNSPEAQAAAGNAVGFTGIRGDQIHPSTINNTLPIVIGQGTDDTAASIDIPIGEQTKTVYAINGQTIPTQGAGDTVYSVQPGDTVTYKLTYTLPISRFEDLQLIDLPPLPVMPVGPASGYNFHATGAPTYTIGEITVASDDTFFSTFSGVTLAISTDATQNSLKLDFGDFHDSAARSTTISLLVTFKVSNAAFADDLFLTNQLRINEDTTNQGTVTVEDLRRFELVRPFVTINKGVVGYNTTGRNLGGIAFHNPTLAAGFTGTIDTAAEASAIGAANVSVGNGVDAGDKVRFAIVAQNTGRGDAYDVKITDAIPTQYQEVAAADANAFITATGLKVFRGDGTTLLTLGTDYTLAWDSTFHTFTITLIDNYTAGNVNNTGTSRDDRNGALSRGEAADASGNAIPIANGSNTIVVLYDLTLKNDVTPNQLLTNTAKVTDYASSEGGDDLADPDKVPGATEPTDTATVTTALPLTSKTLDGTSVNAPGNDPANQATIGELVTYTVTVTVPEGVTPNAHYLDTLDSGLAFVDVISASATSGLTFSGGGLPTNGTSPANATVTNSGRNIDFSFGTITNNTNANNGGTETITITFRAVVLNISGNQSGVQRSNSAQFQWQDNTNTLASIRAGQSTNATSGVTGSQTRVTIVEPSVTPAKTVRNDTQTPTGPFSEIVRADAGDTVRYQIVLTASGTTAYDVTLNDDIPASLTGLSVASVSTGGTVYRNGSLATGGNVFVPSNFVFMGNTLTLAATVILDMEPGATLTVEVTGTFQGATGNIIPNTAQVDWTSLNGEPGTISSYNTSSTERTGADGPGGLNDYQDSDDANIESPIVVRKTIVDTSEASTTGNNVAVGEIVRYRLVASIPEGTANNFQLQDFIPSGLAFLNDGSAKYAFVSNGGGITSTAITDINGLASPATVSGNETTLAGLSSSLVTGVFNNNNIAISSTGHGTGDAIIYSNGQAVYFRFGNLQNSDNDTDFEYVVVEFNALVGNATNNQSGANRDNTFTVLLDTDGNGSAGYVDVVRDVNGDGTGSGEPTTQANDPDNDATTGTPIDQAAQSAPVSVTIVEPVITNLALSANVATADAGDVVTYTATFSNTGNATAFDVSLTDLLSAGNLTLVSGSVVTSSGTVTTGNGGSDTTVRVDIPSVPVGGSVTITYQATLNGTVNPNQVITTNAGVTYTSLPGA